VLVYRWGVGRDFGMLLYIFGSKFKTIKLFSNLSVVGSNLRTWVNKAGFWGYLSNNNCNSHAELLAIYHSLIISL
jgi:hypothetical protein